MTGVALIVVMAAAFGVFVAASRSQRAARAEQAETVRFTVDERGIERDLRDGRHEEVAWVDVVRVDVVTLPKGPWVDQVRIIVHGREEEQGSIVPLGIAESGGLFGGLGRLPGFDHRALHDALAEQKAGTVVVWERPSVS